MILSTTPQIEGRPIREYKGVVTGEIIIGANVLKDFMAGLTDFFGGRSSSYEKVLIEAKDSSMQEMIQRAQALGANLSLASTSTMRPSEPTVPCLWWPPAEQP